MEIRSENAAKSTGNPSSPLVDWILSRSRVKRALDYGCGKLRYARYLARRCSHLTLVDSRLQLERLQIIAGRSTTVERYARRHWPSCRIYAAEDFWQGVDDQYDLVLCANVLSAIPSRGIRARSLRAIKSCLHPTGTCLVVNQYANSYFRQARSRRDAIDHLDGWLLPSSMGASYYGILDRDKILRILRAVGFRLLNAWIDGQSSFVLVRRDPE